jgi:dTDP-glucose 4,6-dehydratase
LFGPRQSTRAVIPSIITQALKQNSISLGSTLPRREFNYAPEIAEAFLKVALSDKGVGETYNVGNGTDLSIAQVVGLILELMNKDCKIIEDPERVRPKLSEVETLQSDSTKMHKEFDWKYGLSGLEGFKQGLIQTIDWYSDSRNLSKFYSDEYGI